MTYPTPHQTPSPSRPAPSTPTTPSSHRRPRRLIAATLVGASLLLAACSSSGSTTSTTKAAPASTAATGSAPSGAATNDAIAIKNFAFAPSSITVAPGATVTVTNKDAVAHTITSSTGAFNTGDIGPGQSKSFTAPKTPGSYPYICSIHQYMTGTLVVSG